MMRMVWVFLLVPALLGAEEYTVEEIHEAYADIFTVEVHEYDDGTYLSGEIAKVDKHSFLSSLINDNHEFFNFLLNNMYDTKCDSLHVYETDSTGVGEHFRQAVCRDTLFDKLLLTMIDEYLRSQGDKIVDFTGIKSYKIDIDEVLATAVRFFYLLEGDEEYSIYMTICIGNHGLHELGDDRDYAVEALCYAAIQRDGRKWFGRLGELVDETNTLCYAEDYDTHFNRRQGAVWMHMAHDPKLREALEKKYKQTRDFLPFEVKGW